MALARTGFATGAKSTASTATVSITPDVGEALFIHIYWTHATVTLNSVAITSGTSETVTASGSQPTITLIGGQTVNSSWHYVKNVGTADAKTITATFSGSQLSAVVSVWRVSGQDTATQPDATPTSSTFVADPAPVDLSTNITTITDGAGIIAAVSAGNGTLTPSSGYTATDLVTGGDWSYSSTQYNMDVGAAGVKTVLGQLGGGDISWLQHLIAIRPAGGGVGVPKTTRLTMLGIG